MTGTDSSERHTGSSRKTLDFTITRPLLPRSNDTFALELRDLGRTVATERAGVGDFRRPGAGQSNAVERRCFWDTIDYHNAQWRVILVKKI